MTYLEILSNLGLYMTVGLYLCGRYLFSFFCNFALIINANDFNTSQTCFKIFQTGSVQHLNPTPFCAGLLK
jgi:hypothetical protein